MVRDGLAASMARPGGQTTGVSIIGADLDLKRLELLHEFVPNARRIAALIDLSTSDNQKRIEAAAGRLNLELVSFPVRNADDARRALDGIAAAGVDAVNVLASPMLNGMRRTIIVRLLGAHLPSIFEWPESAEDGGLIGYGAPVLSLYRRIAILVDKVLRGARPADLPIEQATKFEPPALNAQEFILALHYHCNECARTFYWSQIDERFQRGLSRGVAVPRGPASIMLAAAI
jgi:putative ABC transport system substrate-binding protein